MSVRYVLTPEAHAHVDEIGAYIAQHRADAASTHPVRVAIQSRLPDTAIHEPSAIKVLTGRFGG